MSELYDILTETPPTKVVLLALDQGLWDCERSLAELSALCEANHMEAVAHTSPARKKSGRSTAPAFPAGKSQNTWSSIDRGSANREKPRWFPPVFYED